MTAQQTARTRSPDPHRRERDLKARFAALDHLAAAGLHSELVEHALFAPLGWCLCSRCLWHAGVTR